MIHSVNEFSHVTFHQAETQLHIPGRENNSKESLMMIGFIAIQNYN